MLLCGIFLLFLLNINQSNHMLRIIEFISASFFCITFVLMWFILLLDVIVLMLSFGQIDMDLTFKFTDWSKRISGRLHSKEIELLFKKDQK